MCDHCRQSRSTNHTNSASRDNGGCRPFTGNNRNVFLLDVFIKDCCDEVIFVQNVVYSRRSKSYCYVVQNVASEDMHWTAQSKRVTFNWPERRRRSWISVQQRGRHPRATKQRHTKTHVRQVLRDHGRAVLPHHYRRSTSADDCTFSYVTRRLVRRS